MRAFYEKPTHRRLFEKHGIGSAHCLEGTEKGKPPFFSALLRLTVVPSLPLYLKANFLVIRTEDIPELIQLFLKEFSVKYKMPIPEIDQEVMYTFLQHRWQGNVRQLRNIIERIIILASDNEVIKSHHSPKNFVKDNNPHSLKEPKKLNGQSEEEILSALQITFENKAAAAKLLGISRATLI
jgi:transcriptional regulator with PAS, ATPase and Fis domain